MSIPIAGLDETPRAHRFSTTTRGGRGTTARDALPARNAERHDPGAYWLELEPLPAGVDLTWRARGACRAPDIPTRVFFPGRGDIETVGAARAICADCLVRRECLDFALDVGVEGVWGGKTRQEREVMLGRRYHKRREGETTAARD